MVGGLLDPLPEERVDPESERYFAQFQFSRQEIPVNFSSIDAGVVTPVKDQRRCGSCVAFASVAAIETCFSKITGQQGDYSEQHVMDCGYRKYGASACNGAALHSYLKWAGRNRIELTHEDTYPYIARRQKCPSDLEMFNQGAEISGYYYTYRGNEETLKRLVYEHGAVVVGVRARGPFQRYKGGIFSGCSSSSNTDHAVTAVGYGVENGKDYWLIK